MNSVLSRANAVFAFTLSILAAMTIGCFLSTLLKPYEETVEVRIQTIDKDVKNVTNFGNNRQVSELGFFKFDLDADFSRTFDWNTKQLFLYLTAHYQTKKNTVNQIVLWDYIMLRDAPNKLKLRNQNNKYYFFDDGAGLSGNQNITLTLSMNIIPNVGILKQVTTRQLHQFSFPVKA